ncbi:MAG: class I SAM-dependent methyltransferase [Candidatus Hodarchaeales archaeon]
MHRKENYLRFHFKKRNLKMKKNSQIPTSNLMDYPIVRSCYIEEDLLRPWCIMHQKSQIVLLGAGFDTRAYRFKPFKTNSHVIFEVDFPIVIQNKEKILKNKNPLCDLRRLSADLTDSEWASYLFINGFSSNIPTFWVLEGLVYYMELNEVSHLLTKAADISEKGSQIFVDIINDSQENSFLCSQNSTPSDSSPKPRKWGLNQQEITSFFTPTGWNVSFSFADDQDQNQDVEHRCMVFIHGVKKKA